MKKRSQILSILFFLTAVLFANVSYPQSVCDSVSVSPETVYIFQGTDSAVFIDVTYTGESDYSYAFCSFVFPDSSNIDINDFAITNGVSGPFSFTPHAGYRLIYNNPAIQPNTVVNAFFKLSKFPMVDCLMPVTFIINSSTGINNSQTSLQVKLFPNPFNNIMNVESSTPGFELSIYDLSGRRVYSKSFLGTVSAVNIGRLSEGIYFIIMRNSISTVTRKIVKLRN